MFVSGLQNVSEYQRGKTMTDNSLKRIGLYPSTKGRGYYYGYSIIIYIPKKYKITDVITSLCREVKIVGVNVGD